MISIINYKAGNLTSVERALKHLGIPCRITNNPEEIISSKKVIFPGVGAAGKAMEFIRSKHLDKILYDVVDKNIPFLGICLGTQIILDKSEENDMACLEIIPGISKRFPDGGIKIPHMGWNNISITRPHPILSGIDPRAQFYFVHSFYPDPKREEDTIATTHYGVTFASIIGKGNIVATQFHPEKSGRYGLQMLKNFSKWDGYVK
ncbi:MAG: imidazole glycerol phosphate synthase subunit HisH [Thermodesulfobacteriota bacterium]|nr:imidazole glycerol phosphate synthase subunit HisH [Thermodesulfobacteriota bacterium]